MAASTIGAGFLTNPLIASLSPDQQQSLVQLQQRQMMGQALSQQGLTPVDMSNRQVGGVAYHVSPLEGLAKILQTYEGNKVSTDALGQQAQLASQLTGGLYGTDSSAPAVPAQAAVTGDANTAGLSGLSAGMGAAAPAVDPKAIGVALSATGNAVPSATSTTAGPLTLPGHTAAESRMLAAFAPQAYAAALGSALSPTDTIKNNNYMGVTAEQARTNYQNEATKNSTLTGRWGFATPNGQGGFTPTVIPNEITGSQLTTPDGGKTWGYAPIEGGAAAIKTKSTAEAAGPATYHTVQVWDATANGGKGGMVNQTALNAANAVTPGGGASPAPGVAAPVPGFTPFQNAVRQVESNGNAAAVNPASGASGSMQVMGPTLSNPGFGVAPARDNSLAEKQRVGAEYAGKMQQRYGNDTDAAVAYNWGPTNADKWVSAGRPWSMLPQQTKDYVGQIHAQTLNYGGSAGPAAPPSNSPTGSPAPAPAPAPSGPMASQPPLGVTTATNASQVAPSHLMADSYKNLSSADANYQQSRDALQRMIGLAKQQSGFDNASRFIPEGIATKINSDATEYGKLHATYVSLQGKSLGAGATDASRDTINESVPTFDKPQAAKLSGLNTQLTNLDLSHLKTQFLTPVYQQGDEKAYTGLSAGFDQNIKPSMVPVLQMSGPSQKDAVKAAVKANPALRSNFEWAFQNGMLK